MRKVKEGNIKLSDIKFTENSRLRGQDDVADLMNDIEQHGLLEPIGIRINDNSLIFGNRRVKAFEKLGYNEIPCAYFDDVKDEDLLILNVIENIKRKGITSVEIGRMCHLLEKRDMTRTEIASRLGIKKERVNKCISAYEITKDTPFEKLIMQNAFGKSSSRLGITEGIIWAIQTSLTRAMPGRKMTKNDWKILLPAVEEGKITTKNIIVLRNILYSDPERNLVKALDILDKVKVLNTYISFDEKKLRNAMAKERIESAQEFVKMIMKNYDKDLLF